MKAQITIIGLGQIGGSIGLGLADYADRFLRVGNDIDNTAAQVARKISAVDTTEFNLPSAVDKADIVVLALPVDQVVETMKVIAPELKEGAVVLDCSPLRQGLSQQVAALLPKGRYYLGFIPLLGPSGLETAENGIENADAALFKDGQFAITGPLGTPEQGLKLAADMAGALGATALFADEMEVDGLMAAVHTLPQILAAAFTRSVTGSPGWREKSKFAGRAFKQASAPSTSQDTPAALAAMAQFNQENTLRVIDDLLAELEQVRAYIAGQEQQALHDNLESAHQEHRNWWKGRLSSSSAAERLPQGEIGKYRANWFGNLFGGGKDQEK